MANHNHTPFLLLLVFLMPIFSVVITAAQVLPPFPSPPPLISPPPPPTINAPPSPQPPTTTASPPLPMTTSPPFTTSLPLLSPPTTVPSPEPPTNASSLSPPGVQEGQLNNIIDALMGSGDFGGWVGILSAVNPSSFPLSATLFVPGEGDLTHLSAAATAAKLDPLVVPYHVVPQRLTFSDLRLFAAHTRLPTLLPSKTILITNASLSNFTVDDTPITRPDLYVTAAVVVHGVSSILNYSTYGGGFFSLPGPTPRTRRPSPSDTVSAHDDAAPPFFPVGEVTGRRRSDAACLCTEFPIVLSVACAAFALKIHRIPLAR